MIVLLCSATKQNLTMFRNETILAGKYTTSMLLKSSLGDYHIYQSSNRTKLKPGGFCHILSCF